MTPIKTIVVGTGHLGRIHAKLASEAPHIDLIAVVDAAPDTAALVAHEVGARPATSIEQVLSQCEAAIVATPTVTHHDVCCKLLTAGKHVLVEKPITHTVDEAKSLVDLAQQQGCVLQVGHVERFNPALEAALPHLHDVRLLRATRASGYTFRSTDIGVVMDLMIHDIDVVLSITQSEVRGVRALGFSVLGDHEDLAQAELTFANGAIAQLSASRVSFQPARTLQVYGSSFAEVDFANRQATVVSPRQDLLTRTFSVGQLSADERLTYRNQLFETLLQKETLAPPATNAIGEEQRDFATCIRQGQTPRVSGAAGLAALAVAQRILGCISRHNWDGADVGRQGPLALPAAPVIGGAEMWETLPLRKAG